MANEQINIILDSYVPHPQDSEEENDVADFDAVSFRKSYLESKTDGDEEEEEDIDDQFTNPHTKISSPDVNMKFGFGYGKPPWMANDPTLDAAYFACYAIQQHIVFAAYTETVNILRLIEILRQTIKNLGSNDDILIAITLKRIFVVQLNNYLLALIDHSQTRDIYKTVVEFLNQFNDIRIVDWPLQSVYYFALDIYMQVFPIWKKGFDKVMTYILNDKMQHRLDTILQEYYNNEKLIERNIIEFSNMPKLEEEITHLKIQLKNAKTKKQRIDLEQQLKLKTKELNDIPFHPVWEPRNADRLERFRNRERLLRISLDEITKRQHELEHTVYAEVNLVKQFKALMQTFSPLYMNAPSSCGSANTTTARKPNALIRHPR